MADSETWLGFDWGVHWIGIAVGQTLTQSATPLKPIKAARGIPNWDIVDQLINEWKPKGCVVGIPYNMDGSAFDLTQRANKFRKRLYGRYGIPAEGIDERLTSLEAFRMLDIHPDDLEKAKKANVDGLSAKLILESWFNTRNG